MGHKKITVTIPLSFSYSSYFGVCREIFYLEFFKRSYNVTFNNFKKKGKNSSRKVTTGFGNDGIFIVFITVTIKSATLLLLQFFIFVPVKGNKHDS